MEENHSENHSKEESHSKGKSISGKKRNKRTLQYGAGLLVFALLVVSALWLPQVFFEFSDALMYGEVSLMEQEKLDVLTLTTGYEESLFRRLAGFAEGLAGQRQYYVDEQPKEVTDEIREFLFESVLRFYAYGIYEDMIMGLFTESLGYSPETFARKTGLELYHWNQYVIYSDDYAQGVNFILWCFGLKNSLGDNLAILMDAHDYTVYAVQITGGTGRSALGVDAINKYSTEYNEYSALRESASAVSDYESFVSSLYTQGAAWMTFSIYYEIFGQEELERCFAEIEVSYDMWRRWNKQPPETVNAVLKDSAGNNVEVYLDSGSGALYGADGERWYGSEAGILYYSLPVQENKITFDMYSFVENYDAGQAISSTMGIREIYELIPEFQHVG